MTECKGYSDGGSLTGIIVDATGDSLRFWWDQQARLPGDSNLSPRGCIYIGAKRPGDPNGVRLGKGTECETAFIETLYIIADDSMSRARQDSLYAFLYDSRIPMPQRQPGFNTLTPAEFLALQALDLAKSLERQRAANQ
jgi:hypothetical protein